MKKLVLFLLISLLLFGCSKYEPKEVRIFSDPVIDYDEIDSIIEGGNYIIVDVRTKEEYDESHVKGSINIPYDEIDENTNLDKSKTIIVYCRSGNRSSKAYNNLKSLGYDVYDLGAFDKITLEKE